MTGGKKETNGKKPNELVLYSGLADKVQEQTLHTILAGQGVRSRKISGQDTTRTIGDLTGLQDSRSRGAGQPEKHGEHADNSAREMPSEPMIVMHGFSDSRLDELLSAVRKADGLKITLKAIVTMNNRHWSYARLATELRREHAFMQAFRTVQGLVGQAEYWLENQAAKQSHDPSLTELSEKLRTAVQRAVKMVTGIRNQEQVDMNQLASVGQDLSTLLREAAMLSIDE